MAGYGDAGASVTGDHGSDGSGNDRSVNRLATERSMIFAKGGKNKALSEADRQRLRAIEQELDECFALRRQRWAARDAHRFSRYHY